MVSEAPEVDPIYFDEFNQWLSALTPVNDDTASPFLKRIVTEDVEPCLTFANSELAAEVLDAIKKNTLEMVPYSDEMIKKCELSNIEKNCPYRLRTDSDKSWVFISLQARNRVSILFAF